MKVISVELSVSEIIEIEGSEWTTYRRHSPDNWEVLMGESWEQQYFTEELELLYQEFKGKE